MDGCGAEWIEVYDGGDYDRVQTLGVDARGNVIAAGYTRTGATYAFWVSKYDAEGQEQWTVEGPGVAQSVATDNDGNVVVSGYSERAERWIRKYGSNGDEDWTIEGGEPLPGIAIDPEGSILVAASGMGATKYDAQGEELWTSLDDSSSSTALASDRSGNVLLVGSVEREEGAVDGFNPHTDVVVRKLDPDGVELWVRSYDGGRDDSGHAIAVDGSDAVFVVGRSRLETTGGSVGDLGWIRKYSSTGEVIWTRTEEAAGPRDIGNKIAIASDGSVLVAWLGLFSYDEDGSLLGTLACRADHVAFAPSGSMLLAGSVELPSDSFLQLSDVWLGARAIGLHTSFSPRGG